MTACEAGRIDFRLTFDGVVIFAAKAWTEPARIPLIPARVSVA